MTAEKAQEEKKTLVGFEFEGNEYKVVAEAAKSYRLCKRLSCAGKYGPDSFYAAIETLFDGHDEEYVEEAGGMFRLNDLISAALMAVGSKNS